MVIGVESIGKRKGQEKTKFFTECRLFCQFLANKAILLLELTHRNSLVVRRKSLRVLFAIDQE